MRRIQALCIVFLFLFSGMACAADKGHVFLWSMSSGRGTVHILGSIHVLRPDAYPLDKRITEAYQKSSRVVFEADLKEMGNPAVQKALLSQGTYRGKASIKNHISKETYGLLVQKLKSAGLPESQFDKYKPWLCAVSLSAVELVRLGFDPKSGIDAHFYSLAAKDRREMIFLETAASQIELLAKTLGNRQEDLLKQTLKELEVIGRSSSDMVRAWKKGDAVKLGQITDISLREYPEVEEALFTRRNAAWVTKIEEQLGREGDTLVIVGAGHLVGPQGILALLEQKGRVLTQR